MFTGIVEEVGRVTAVRDHGSNRELVVEARMAGKLRIDQSVAHNGVCLTVVELFMNPVLMATTGYRVTAVKETLERTNLGMVGIGDGLNLERCLKLGDRLDGHMVQGHIDTTVRCTQVVDNDGSWTFSFELPDQRHLLVQKGSVCINGVSLTIADMDDQTFSVAIIPYTHEHTTFRSLRSEDRVNIEFDVIGRYVERMLSDRARP